MHKKKLPQNEIERAAKRSTDNTQTKYVSSTDDTLKRYDVRLSADDWEWLRQYANSKGLKRSQVIRMAIKEFRDNH